ncbi:MAG: YafY family transcriptional regulator [Eubacteriaceae bacterium]|nr:YafY family transcriptional regulator [Eubacteriaceae bacterium]
MKVDRLVSIIMILLNKNRVNAKELADLFEVSTRTIYRDIDTISLAGIPLHAITGVGGGFEIMERYKVDKKVFSASDLSAILMGLSSLSNMMRGDELINALAKIKSFIPADRAKEIELKANQVYIDLSPWMGNANMQPYLEIIKKAVQENKILAFEYTDRYNNKTARTAEPYQLVLKSSYWYWQGYCHTRNDFRLFKLSRTSDLQIKDDSFIPRDYKNPQLEFAGILDTMQTKIKIRIHKSLKDRVLDYCAYDHFSPDGDGHYIVIFPFIENDYYYNILLSFGDKCECIDPLHVRTEMKRRIHGIAALYQN